MRTDEPSAAASDDGTFLEESRVTAAHALRDIVHAFVRAQPAEDAYDEIRTLAEQLVARLDATPRRDRMALMQAAREKHGGTFPVGVGAGGFNDRAVAGLANPAGVDIQVEPGGADVLAHVLFRKGFEGPPGRAHGGMIAAAFDDVTGFIIGRIGQPAFTGELTVRYVGPTPIETPLVMTARLDGQERRKLFISGELISDGVVTATCKAIYITIDPSVFAASPDPR
ncbi:MAG: PaaI family thioesterase [Acidimicrobiia bacterium]